MALRDVLINSERYTRVFGGSVPAPIWKEFMEIVLAKYPTGEFPSSLGIGYYNEVPFAEVPDVAGLPLEEAEDAIFAAHLRPEVEEVGSPEDQGMVLGTDPEAGEETDEGATVLVKVSTGVTALLVPDLIGLSSDAALDLLRTAQEEAATGRRGRDPLRIGERPRSGGSGDPHRAGRRRNHRLRRRPLPGDRELGGARIGR